MQAWQAIIIGIIEGLTEYLPVSSTGHILLTQRLLGIPENEASRAYAICVQAGAILAVLGVYRRRVLEIFRGILDPWGGPAGSLHEGLRLGLLLILAFLPAAVVGLTCGDWIDRHLMGLWPTVIAWAVGGCILLGVGMLRPASAPANQGALLSDLTWRGALVIGSLQCVAMWPGTSRSLVTILGGVLVGLSLPAALELSFLLGVVTLTAATLFKLGDSWPVMQQTYTLSVMLLGGLSAWFFAWIAVRWMIGYLANRGLTFFGFYRVALAASVGWAIWKGYILP